MELRHLRYFVAVGRCLSFTKAAEALHISQPPLSRQIQELEEEVGTALFLREAKKVSLTRAGEYLLGEAEKILEGIEAACGTARMIGQRARALNIGCVSLFLGTGMAPFIDKVRAGHPELRLELLVMPTEAQGKALLSGGIDVGFARSWIGQEGLAFEPVAQESLAIVFPASGDFPEEPEACMKALSGRPFIAMSRSSAAGLVERIEAACAAFGVSPSVSLECNDAFSILSMVAAGAGWSIVPSLEMQSVNVSGIRGVKLPQTLVIGMAYRADVISDDARRFIELAREHFASPAQA
jgi:DNA-binding transcriptional LysR family regulator